MHLVARVRLLSRAYMGQTGDAHEWPPSPYRLFCAFVDAAHHSGWTGRKGEAMRWFERLPAPSIVTPKALKVRPYLLGVPNNNDPSKAALTNKEVMETIPDKGEMHYVWPLSDSHELVNVLAQQARFVDCLGRGETHAVCSLEIVDDDKVGDITGVWWKPTNTGDGTKLRVPCEGTYDGLDAVFEARKGMIRQDSIEVSLPRVPRHVVGYGNRSTRNYVKLSLQNEDGSFASVDPRKAATVAAMLRHECMGIAEHEGIPDDVISRFVRGKVDGNHYRLSYVPLPSIGHRHVDGRIRRAVVCEPIGLTDPVFDRIAARLGRTRGVIQSSDGKVQFIAGRPLQTAEDHRMFRRYLSPSDVWYSVTPVVLPMHLNGSRSRRTKAVRRMIDHAGYSGMVKEFEISRAPFTPQGEHPFDYQRPKYLDKLPMFHMRIRFYEPVDGPVVLGNGRHCGLGVFARSSET